MSNQMESGRGILSIDFGPYPNMESRPRFFEGAKFELAEMQCPLFVTKATAWCVVGDTFVANFQELVNRVLVMDMNAGFVGRRSGMEVAADARI